MRTIVRAIYPCPVIPSSHRGATRSRSRQGPHHVDPTCFIPFGRPPVHSARHPGGCVRDSGRSCSSQWHEPSVHDMPPRSRCFLASSSVCVHDCPHDGLRDGNGECFGCGEAYWRWYVVGVVTCTLLSSQYSVNESPRTEYEDELTVRVSIANTNTREHLYNMHAEATSVSPQWA